MGTDEGSPPPPLDYARPPRRPRWSRLDRVVLVAGDAVLAGVGAVMTVPLWLALARSSSANSGGPLVAVLCCGSPAVVGLICVGVGVRGVWVGYRGSVVDDG